MFHIFGLIVLIHILYIVQFVSHDNSDGKCDESDELFKRYITSFDFRLAPFGLNFSLFCGFWFCNCIWCICVN